MNIQTQKQYVKDVYLKTSDATILEITERVHGKDEIPAPAVVLDQTIFFPEGGGQPCDTGTINGIPIGDVIEADGIIYHFPEDDQQTSSGCGPTSLQLLKEGQTVRLAIDWNRRFRNMQRHCGEHILSGIFYQETGGINRGFHMGEAYMTIDIDVSDISWEQLMNIERLANEVIRNNKPVITRHLAAKADAEYLPLRKPLAIEKDITIVCVGDPENPADCVACCGTHPAFAGEVALIKILKAEHYKGMTRVYLQAGQDALNDYDRKHDLITELMKKYSADEFHLTEKMKIQDEKNKLMRQELYELKQLVLSLYTQELTNYYNHLPAAQGGTPIHTREYDILKADDLLRLGRNMTNEIKGLLLLIAPAEQTVFLFSKGDPDCGKLVKENAPIYHGKGGGNAKSARAMFGKREYLDTFLDLLEKHLR